MAYFPAVNSPQRMGRDPSVSNAATKVPLRRGFSLMDWVRLTKSGKDLRGTGCSRMLRITTEELSRHNKCNDAWMAIRGFVYNVTNYMDFHPGGEKELMRGAGKDATHLFEEVHRWVNFESMLEACLIGKLEHGPTKSKEASASLLLPQSSNAGLSPLKTPTNSGSSATLMGPQIVISLPDSKSKPTTSWYQNADCVTLVCYTKTKNLERSGCVVCDLVENGNRLLGEIFTGDDSVSLNVAFEHPVRDHVEVTVKPDIGNVMINMFKKDPSLHWKNIGEQGIDHCSLISKKNLTMRYRSCALVHKTSVSHDTSLYHFRLHPTSYMRIPVGHHVYFQSNVEGIQISRPFTVILPSLVDDAADNQLDGHNLYAMIKTYDDGALTPVINTMRCGDELTVSMFEGDYNPGFATLGGRVCMIAAGTGFTPMARILGQCLTKKMGPDMTLLFFNKEERDILWKEQLDVLQDNHPDRFSVKYVLSKPTSGWRGLTGRVTLKDVQDLLSVPEKLYTGHPPRVLVCGPPTFTQLVLKFLQDLKVAQSQIHAFK